MMDVEDIVSSTRVNTEWVTAGLRWISLTGEQRLSLSQQSESEMRRHGTRGMSGRRLNDDVEHGDLATESCADRVMKILEKRVKEGELRWWRWDDGKASAVFCLHFCSAELSPLPPPSISMVICMCVWRGAGIEERERVKLREHVKSAWEQNGQFPQGGGGKSPFPLCDRALWFTTMTAVDTHIVTHTKRYTCWNTDLPSSAFLFNYSKL